MKSALVKQLERVRKAARKLEGTDGRRIARRNARARVLAALRAVRAALDRNYPAIIERKGTKRVQLHVRAARLERAGWRQVSAEIAGVYASFGVRIQRIGKVRGHGFAATYWVPDWARAIGLNAPARLREALRDPVVRKAYVAQAMLLQGDV